MTTLHIEHPVTDFEVWAGAFAGFEEHRRRAGVRHARVLRPLDDERYVVIDLDFDGPEQAEKFLGFLTSQVWSAPARSPGLAGMPMTRLLECVQGSA